MYIYGYANKSFKGRADKFCIVARVYYFLEDVRYTFSLSLSHLHAHSIFIYDTSQNVDNYKKVVYVWLPRHNHCLLQHRSHPLATFISSSLTFGLSLPVSSAFLLVDFLLDLEGDLVSMTGLGCSSLLLAPSTHSVERNISST